MVIAEFRLKQKQHMMEEALGCVIAAHQVWCECKLQEISHTSRGASLETHHTGHVEANIAKSACASMAPHKCEHRVMPLGTREQSRRTRSNAGGRASRGTRSDAGGDVPARGQQEGAVPESVMLEMRR